MKAAKKIFDYLREPVGGLLVALCIITICISSWLPFNAIKITISGKADWLDVIAIIVAGIVFFCVVFDIKEMIPLWLSIPYIAVWIYGLVICIDHWDQVLPIQALAYSWGFLFHLVYSIKIVILRIKDRIEMHEAGKKLKENERT